MRTDSAPASAGGRLDVISCGTGFPADAAALVAAADAVFGSRFLKEACPIPARDFRVMAARTREDAEDALRLCREGRRVVVLASGDALFRGVGGVISRLARPDDPVIFHPGVTAFQALFHRLGLPWDDARMFSVHAGGEIPARAIAEAPLAVIHAGTASIRDVARAVIAAHPASAERAAVVAERLGRPEERLAAASLAEIAEADFHPTSLLAVFPHRRTPGCGPAGDPDAPAAAPELSLGLPDERYVFENHLITAPEVRAAILAALRLPAWGVLWDVGAGSGSVGLEAAGLRPHLRVFAAERVAERCAMLEENRRRLGVANHVIRQGAAPDILRRDARPPLPDPDRVFVGGGGRDLPDILSVCMDRLAPGGLLVAAAVTLESLRTLLDWMPERRAGLFRMDAAGERPLADRWSHLKPRNGIHVFSFRRGDAA